MSATEALSDAAIHSFHNASDTAFANRLQTTQKRMSQKSLAIQRLDW
ncbi:MAG: hypothetical protein ACK4GC_05685 [Paracoccaceae bacterium]